MCACVPNWATPNPIDGLGDMDVRAVIKGILIKERAMMWRRMPHHEEVVFHD